MASERGRGQTGSRNTSGVRTVSYTHLDVYKRQVREDIRTHLALRDPYEVTTSFDRPNLYFETRRALPSQKPKELLELVLKEGNHAGIVYCSTTRQVDETVQLLQSRSIRAAAYHAKLDADTRRQNQDDLDVYKRQAPSVLAALGLLEGKNATAHAAFQDKLAGAHVLDTEVVVDGNITTSYGLGGAIPFALELVRQLAGEAEADRIRSAIAYRH